LNEEVIYRGFRPENVGGPARVYRIIVEGGEEDRQELTPGRSQKLFNHSPTGFQWGYSGSGCAQLALALLIDATGDNYKALTLHQDFKREFVSRWGEKWQIAKSEILSWTKQHEAMARKEMP
jgi:hypothetical protein